jgi:histidinol-phosphate aminotransferase
MHLLQNPMGTYPGVRKTIHDALNDVETFQYPDPEARELRRSLSQQLGIPPEQIALGVGSSELLDRTFRAFSARPGHVVLTKPTWGFAWQLFQRYGLNLVQVPHIGSLESQDLRADLDGIAAACTADTRLVYLVNPCNPTGSILDPTLLGDFLDSLPSHATILLDEAYYDYVEPQHRFDLAPRLGNLRCRVLAYRTFSKFFALSGFRVGWVYGNTEDVDLLRRFEVPFSISGVAQKAAWAALQDAESRAETYELNHRERRRIEAELGKMQIAHLPSQTNFVLLEAPTRWEEIRSAAREHGLYMPNIDGAAFVKNWGITTVGTPEHNDHILEIFSRS